jgi:hypothetical protein
MYTSILIGVDRSQHDENALAQAVDIARGLIVTRDITHG